LNRWIRLWASVAKLRRVMKPPAVVGREHQTTMDAPKVLPDGAVRKKRGANPGDLSRVDG
jgi:hypothetical protein